MSVACRQSIAAPIHNTFAHSSSRHAAHSLSTCCDVCRFLVESARRQGLEVIDRCNLTVLLEPGQENLAQYLADWQVHVSIPAVDICTHTGTAHPISVRHLPFT